MEEYSIYRKDYCEICGIKSLREIFPNYFKKTKMTVHHKDHNHFNNNPDNLQTLCRKCHDKVHQDD